MVIVRQTKINLKILITNGDTIDLWESFNGALNGSNWRVVQSLIDSKKIIIYEKKFL